MSDFIREVDEELRQDQFKRFLNRYWIVLLAIVVLVLAGVGAWRGMDYVSTQKAESVGGHYMDALALARDGKSAEAIAALQTVVQDGPPGYRLLARFRIAAETGVTDKTAGAKLYDALATDPTVDAALQNVAKIRAALLLVDSLPYAEFQQRLAPLADANSITRNAARELLALAALKADKTDEAGRLLDAIETDPTSSATLRQRAERLLGLVKSAGAVPPPPIPPPSSPAPSEPAAAAPAAGSPDAPPADTSAPTGPSK